MNKAKLSYRLDRVAKYAGLTAAFLVVILALLVTYDAMMRYLFSAGSIALQEIEWHLYDVIFLLGISYALKHDKHVRVDIFYERYSEQSKLLIQIFSMLLLVIPFSLLMMYNAWDMTLQSYLQHEISSDPGGLTHRYLIKGMIVVAFGLLILQAISEVLKAYRSLVSYRGFWIMLSLSALLLMFEMMGAWFDWAF
ncbi:MAG TPA: TRAP transporter small permease subunit, partial [Epsilonproteobacteria bacterium]|nr:TRAP transporter small permease subunit [Campylobacterota bacterium]